MKTQLGLIVALGLALAVLGCSQTGVESVAADDPAVTSAQTPAPPPAETPGATSALGERLKDKLKPIQPIKIDLEKIETLRMPSVEKGVFDTLASGKKVHYYLLTNLVGTKAKIIDFGATLVSLEVADKNGAMADVVLGCDTVEAYRTKAPYFGSIVGRYANRIALGKFTLDGAEYTLATNNAPNHLHGGMVGFDKNMWEAEEVSSAGDVGVKFTYRAKDGEEGYPGNMTVTATYTLTMANELRIDYAAETDKATPVNLTHHSYWNLGGHTSGDILGHELTVAAGQYTPVDETFIPTGELASVEGTPFDFRTATAIGARVDQLPNRLYDLNYVIDNADGTLRFAAKAKDPKSGRVMEIFTTEPGIQFYTGNGLDGSFDGKGGARYATQNGFCLETQKFPDSPNKPQFPSSILRPGEKYTHTIVHKFSVE